MRQAAQSLGLELIDVRATLLDPVDLRGLPRLDQERAVWRSVLREFVSLHARNDYSWSRPNRRFMTGTLAELITLAAPLSRGRS